MNIQEAGEKLYRKLQRACAAGMEGKRCPVDLRRVPRADRRHIRAAYEEGKRWAR